MIFLIANIVFMALVGLNLIFKILKKFYFLSFFLSLFIIIMLKITGISKYECKAILQSQSNYTQLLVLEITIKVLVIKSKDRTHTAK